MINLKNNSLFLKTIKIRKIYLFIGLVISISLFGILFTNNEETIRHDENLAVNDSLDKTILYDPFQIPANQSKAKVTIASKQATVEDYLYYDLTEPSNISAEDIDEYLNDTNLEGLGTAFLDAELKYNVNAKYLMAHAIHESDWGRSKIASDKYNLFGFRAYDANPYENAKAYSSYEESIDHTARFISKNYLSEDGKYYNGPTLKGMNTYYATSDEWSYKIAKIMKNFDEEVFQG